MCVRMVELDAAPRIRIEPKPGERAFDTTAAHHAWDSLVLGNPRYHNGSILAFDEHEDGVIAAHIDEYRYHAVRDHASTGVDLLSVTCLLTHTDEAGVFRAMLGLRALNTHRYGGLWEFGPAGGIDAPETPGELDERGILDQARREAREEIGLELSGAPARAWGILFDDAVGSVDIIVRFALREIPAPDTNWEYNAVRWASVTELHEWQRARPHTLIPPAHAIIERLDTDAYP